ncbi:MAG: hypothetical protein H6948_17330 [Zoogloeaceae bacterium]|nr:hypothetical protein [Zoogloeaceae bacterium]
MGTTAQSADAKGRSSEPTFAWWGWGFVVVCAYIAGASALGTGSIVAGLLGLLATVLCAPPFRRWVWQRTGWHLAAVPVTVACFVLLVTAMVVAGVAASERDAALEEQARIESAQRVAKLRADRLAHFEANKLAILKAAASQARAGKAADALTELGKYVAVSKDPDLVRAWTAARVQVARDDLAREDSLPLQRKAELYQILAEAEPNNVAWSDWARRFSEELERRQRYEAEVRRFEADRAARAESVKAQFSSWDGSHRNVERAVKARMKNPSSYEHVETRYTDTGIGLQIVTTIRGTNSFGAVVPSRFVASVDYDGNVLSLTESR